MMIETADGEEINDTYILLLLSSPISEFDIVRYDDRYEYKYDGDKAGIIKYCHIRDK